MERNEEANDLTLFGLDDSRRNDLKKRFLEGRAKIREVMLFYGITKKCAEEIVSEWRSGNEPS